MQSDLFIGCRLQAVIGSGCFMFINLTDWDPISIHSIGQVFTGYYMCASRNLRGINKVRVA